MDLYRYDTNQQSGLRTTYHITGTTVGHLVGRFVSLEGGLLAGAVFFIGEKLHDSYHDMTDPDRNPNTIHSIGEIRLNQGWMENNIERGLGEGIEY